MKAFATVFAAAVICVATTPERARGQRTAERYTGVFVGLDVGIQNLIGGSLVRGVDVLQQASRPVLTLTAGARYEAPFGTVVGFELGMGLTNGNMQRQEGSPPFNVDYRNRRQRHWNIILGQAFGAVRRTLLYGYLSEVTRTFNVTVNDGPDTFAQRDEQGLLRFGGGIERRVSDLWSFRAGMGSSHADFGGRQTNFTPERRLDASLGAVWQVRFPKENQP